MVWRLGVGCPTYPLQELAFQIPPPTRPSSREVGIRVPFFSVVYFSRGTLPTKKETVKGRYKNYEHLLRLQLAELPGLKGLAFKVHSAEVHPAEPPRLRGPSKRGVRNTTRKSWGTCGGGIRFGQEAFKEAEKNNFPSSLTPFRSRKTMGKR